MVDAVNVFLQIGIVGAVLSALLQFIKAKWGVESIQTKVITITLSIVLGAGIYFLYGTPAWVAILGVLGMASTVYAIFLK